MPSEVFKEDEVKSFDLKSSLVSNSLVAELSKQWFEQKSDGHFGLGLVKLFEILPHYIPYHFVARI